MRNKILLLILFLLCINIVHSLSTSDVYTYYKFDNNSLDSKGTLNLDDSLWLPPDRNYTDGFINQGIGDTLTNVFDATHYFETFRLNFSDYHTLTAWIKTSGSEDYSFIVARGSGIGGLLLSSNNKFWCWDSGDNVIESVSSVEDGEWHFLSCSFSPTGTKLYTDGVYENSRNGSVTFDHKFYLIGIDADTQTRAFDGIIDEIGVFNVTLSDDDITLLYNNGSGLSYPFNVTYSPPTTPEFILPYCNGYDLNITYGSTSDIQVNWTESISELGYNISYNLCYTNYDGFDTDCIGNFTENNYTLSSSEWNSLFSPDDYYKLYVNSTDGIETVTGIMDCYIYICVNNWVQSVTPCVDNTQLITYTDTSYCNEQLGVPLSNNTYQSCTAPPIKVSLDEELMVIIILIVLLILSSVLAIAFSEYFFGVNAILTVLLGIMFNYYNYPDILLIACGILIIVFLGMLFLIKIVKR